MNLSILPLLVLLHLSSLSIVQSYTNSTDEIHNPNGYNLHRRYSLDGFLLLSDIKEIRIFDTDGNFLEVIARQGAQSIDYDCSNNDLVWAGYPDNEVYIQRNILTTLPHLKYGWEPTSIAVDSTTQNIYIAERLSSSIFVYNKVSGKHEVIYKVEKTDSYAVWNIVLDLKSMLLFIQSDYEIIKTNLKGSYPTVIYSENYPKQELEPMHMNRIAIDVTSKRLFWLNDVSGQIWSINYEGTDKKLHFEKDVHNEVHMSDSLAIHNGMLFWADFFNRQLLKIDLIHKSLKKMYVLGDMVPQAITFINC